MSDVNNGTVVGMYGTILRTTNGGTSWVQQNSTTGYYLYCVDFTGANIGTAVGAYETILRTTTGGGLCTDIPIASGWNLLSVPRNAQVMTATALYPTKTSPPYFYSNGYISNDTLSVGKGFWLRFGGSQTVSICGSDVTSSIVPLKAGWNIIGGYEKNVPVAGITTNPAGILTSSFYGYDNGYTVPTALIPGKGYWIRSSQDGVMNLNTGFTRAGYDISNIFTNAGALYIVDNAGSGGTLYFTCEQIERQFYDLPPLPPAGVFDVRFNDNTMVSSSPNEARIVKMSSAEFPVILRAKDIDLRISDILGGKIFIRDLRAGEEIIISNPELSILSITPVRNENIYELRQNYPNPFNPTTTITYQIAKTGMVSLIVYDALGREVKTLVREAKAPGKYSVEFNASKLSSGVYFYTMRAGEYTAAKKLLLMK
jgi:hypothetical protein